MASTNGFRVKDGIVQSYPKEDKLVIPDNVHTLTSIFAYDDFISSVKIPSSVTRIGESAFYDCDDLNDVTIPGSVRTIEKDAFGDLAALYNQGNILINQLGVLKREEIRHMREQVSYIKVGIVYLTVIQESQNVVAYTINLLKMNQKFQEGN